MSEVSFGYSSACDFTLQTRFVEKSRREALWIVDGDKIVHTIIYIRKDFAPMCTAKLVTYFSAPDSLSIQYVANEKLHSIYQSVFCPTSWYKKKHFER